ncbi:unnamed protein product [Sphagnum balticum]
MSSSVAGMGLVAVSGSSTSPAPAPISSLASFSSHGNFLFSPPCVPVLVRKRTWKVRAGEPSEKSLEVMRKFSEQYARRSDTFFCVDKGVTAVVVKGLAEHKDTLGAPLCPCRHYDDKVAEVQQGFWNCPCVPMRERKECHCMLFLTPENDFAGEDQHISLKEIQELTA